LLREHATVVASQPMPSPPSPPAVQPQPLPAPSPPPATIVMPQPRDRAVVPPPLPRAAEAGAFAERAVPPPPARDLERFVGLAVLGRVGVAAVLLAAAYFGQLGWTHLGPGARAALVYAGGLLMVGAGFVLRPRVDAKYTA